MREDTSGSRQEEARSLEKIGLRTVFALPSFSMVHCFEAGFTCSLFMHEACKRFPLQQEDLDVQKEREVVPWALCANPA